MTNKITIEWKHFNKDGETCNRCSKTGEDIREVIVNVGRKLKPQGITLNFKETKLDKDDIHDSNMILINNRPLENILNAQVAENHCDSCSCLTDESTSCRTIFYKGKTYEEIPSKLISSAIRITVNNMLYE